MRIQPTSIWERPKEHAMDLPESVQEHEELSDSDGSSVEASLVFRDLSL